MDFPHDLKLDQKRETSDSVYMRDGLTVVTECCFCRCEVIGTEAKGEFSWWSEQLIQPVITDAVVKIQIKVTYGQ